jgi:hypothetical protein
MMTLLEEIEAYLAQSHLAATTFGQRVAKDTYFVQRLRNGGDVTTKTAERVRAWMAANKPEKPTPAKQDAA